MAENNNNLWLNSVKEKVSEKQYQLIKMGKECLENNIYFEHDLPWGNKRIIIPSNNTYKGAWNWDSAFHAMTVSRWDPELALEQCFLFFEKQSENGMFPDAILDDGRIFERTTKPPVFAWALMEIFKNNDFSDTVYKYIFEKLKKNEEFWCEKRKKGELFHYDANYSEEYFSDCKNESGWDTSIRWDKGANNIWAIDLNCYMVLFYRAMVFFAEKLNYNNFIEIFKQKEEDLKRNIEEKLWNDKTDTYCDYDFNENKFTDILTPASFMPLFAEIASEERAEKMFNHAKNPCEFYPLFPTVSYDNEKYSSFDYWRGPTWLNTAFFAVKGLKNYGYAELAHRYKDNILEMCYNENRGIFEYYDSKTGKGLGAEGFGWSAAFIIEFILEI